MKEIFDRHQERLTNAERHSIWRSIAPARPSSGHGALRWGLSAAAATLAVVVLGSYFLFQPYEKTLSMDPTSRTARRPVAGSGELTRRPEHSQTESQGSSRESDTRLYSQRLDRDGARPSEPLDAAVPMAPEAGAELEEMVVTNEGLVGGKDSRDRTRATVQSRGGASGYVPQSIPAPPPAAEPMQNAPDASTWGRMKGTYSDGPVAQSAPTPTRAAKPDAKRQAAAARPPMVPTTGGTALPNDEEYDSMFFRNYGVNPFIATDEDALSTFAVDVDNGSYTVARRYINLGSLPDRDAVRVEEFVNYFPQGYPKFERDDFRILIDGAPSPFGSGYHLLRVGLKGREIDEWDRKPAHLTFVVDVSGSMAREDRLGLVKRSLTLLVDQLRDNDRIGIVVYGSQGQVILEPTSLGEALAYGEGYRRFSDDLEEEQYDDWRAGRRRILNAIESLSPNGSTNAEEGLLLAYDMARRSYRSGAINRIVLCSDGVANVGRTGPESILRRVRSEADRGIHLSTIGFGMGNYNDVLMEQLANKGDGNYYYVDDLDEARRVFVENLTGTLQTIAKDAKIQVEFDPARVQRYRLLGFENRDVADRDFRNDKVDAGEIGAGHEVTALYEVKLAPGVRSGTIATVRLRYARPEHEGRRPDVREISRRFSASDLERRFRDASPHFRLDATVAEFAEILRGSYWAKESRLTDVLPLARNAARDLRSPEADEFVGLVEKAARIQEAQGAEGGR